MNPLTKAAIGNVVAQERDSKFVTFSIYLVAAVGVVTTVVAIVERLAK